MTLSAAVSGATGYAGGEVIRLLASHPEVRVDTVAAQSSAGSRMGEVAPHLHSVADLVVRETTTETLSGHDVVFLALPHGASAEVAANLPEGTLVIDAGADHRLESAVAWDQFYGGAWAGSWPYGLPELIIAPGAVDGPGNRQRERLVGASRIAVPGCYPTSVQLALAPGLSAGPLDPEDLVVVSASGLSGAGKSPKPHLMAAEAMSTVTPYGVGGGHRHVPEMQQGLGKAAGSPVSLSFTPTLAPMPRGILTTATARLSEAGRAAANEEIRAVWERAYAEEPFVHLLAAGRWPSTKQVQGSNHVHLQVAVDRAAGRVVVCCALDNLTKGTAGAAVQSMNIALRLPETTGLTQEGLLP